MTLGLVVHLFLLFVHLNLAEIDISQIITRPNTFQLDIPIFWICGCEAQIFFVKYFKGPQIMRSKDKLAFARRLKNLNLFILSLLSAFPC